MVDRLQLTIFTGEIRMQSLVSIDRSEVIHNRILNESKLKDILKMRIKFALLNLKDLIEEELEKL